MDPMPDPDGPQSLSSLLQIVLNEIVVGRLDIAQALLTTVIQQLQGAGQ